MTRIHEVPVQLLTEETFHPFGEVLAPKSGPPDFQGLNSAGWKARFDVDDAPMIMTLSSQHKGFRFTKMECHFRVTQTFIPVGRVPSIVAVAAPTDRRAAPSPEDVRAFLLDGTAGYAFRKGTWHSLDRYPLYPPSAHMVIVTSRNTQIELETVPRNDWVFTQEVDFESRFGIVFQLRL